MALEQRSYTCLIKQFTQKYHRPKVKSHIFSKVNLWVRYKFLTKTVSVTKKTQLQNHLTVKSQVHTRCYNKLSRVFSPIGTTLD